MSELILPKARVEERVADRDLTTVKSRTVAVKMQSRARFGSSIEVKVGFDRELLADVDRLLSNGRGSVAYGSRSALINNLLRIWLRAERERLARAARTAEKGEPNAAV